MVYRILKLFNNKLFRMEKTIMTNKVTYIKKNSMKHYTAGTTWEQLLLAADSDFVGFLLLSYFGISDSTPLWMSEQAVEKYLKSFLLKNDNKYIPYKDGHRLFEIWKKFETNLKDEHLTYEISPDYHHFVKQLGMNNKSTELRYSYGITISVPIFLRLFTEICTYLRKLILGTDSFNKRGPFGIAKYTFGGHDLAFMEKIPINSEKIVIPYITRLLGGDNLACPLLSMEKLI